LLNWLTQMKALLPLACVFVAFTAQLNAADPSTAPDQQVVAAIKEIQAQQAQIADNQAKIDTKLAGIVEAVRVARIYSSRGGR
jgi:ABC-type transporter MlaC component